MSEDRPKRSDELPWKAPADIGGVPGNTNPDRRNDMADELSGRRIAFLMANEGVEEVELTEPLKAVREAGADADLVAPEKAKIQAFDHLDKSSTFDADRSTSEISLDEYDGVVLPGGVANPDALRLDENAVRFLSEFVAAGKPLGVICHGPWTLVEADVLRGRRITSWPSLRTDIRNAGGDWVDEQVVVDEGLVSSRKPDDLPAFCAKIVEEFAEGRHEVPRSGAAARA